jgi:hypothetical protein
MTTRLLTTALPLIAHQLPTALLMLQQPEATKEAMVSLANQSTATIATYALAVSICSALISAITGYVQFRTYRARRPAVVITLTDLPPYTDNNATTYVAVKNVGTGATTRRLDITVFCSWMPLLSYRLNLPSESYCLEPNEEYWWRFRMNDRVVPNSTITVRVRDADRDYWETRQHIESVMAS